MRLSWFKMAIIVSCIMLLSACMQNTNTNNETTPNNPPINNHTPEQNGESYTESIILYYSDNDLMNIYKVRAEAVVEEGEEIEQAAIDAWLAGPEEAALTKLLPAEASAEFLRVDQGVAHISFSSQIREATLGSTGEAAIVDQITMLMEQFGHEQTQILVDGQVTTELLGHMTYDEPFDAREQDDFAWYEGE